MVLEISLSNEQMEKYKSIYQQIIVSMTKYIFNSKINSLVIGISGGLDSAVNTIICNEVCKQLGIPLYGYFIQIESNKPEEKERANLIGKHYCNEYKEVDLTKEYIILRDAMESSIINKYETDFQKKIRFGNIKARMRMIFLYNVSQAYKGIVLDNDNKTERNLGFWTLNGDVGDITPLASLWKTEVYELMQYIKEAVCTTEEEKNMTQSFIDAVPTDGLGITNSDLDQLGAESYEQVDKILQLHTSNNPSKEKLDKLIEEYGEETVLNVINRHIRSEFKRNHPYRIKL